MSKALSSVKDIDHDKLVSEVFYDPEVGEFFPRRKRRGRVPSKLGLGDVNYDGYIRINVLGRRYYAHRLAWFYVHGVWPSEQMDHINGNRSDNRIENLREATQSGNGQNKKMQRNNTSGCIGVTWNRRKKKWQAQINADGRRNYLGYFDIFDDAVAARKEAKLTLHTFAPKERATTPEYRRAPCRIKS